MCLLYNVRVMVNQSLVSAITEFCALEGIDAECVKEVNDTEGFLVEGMHSEANVKLTDAEVQLVIEGLSN